MGPNDVTVVRVTTRETGTVISDITLETGSNFEVTVEAEVGNALFSTGGSYEVQLIIRDFSDATDGSDVIHNDTTTGNFGDANWAALKNEFVYTVPAAVITGREGHIMEAIALLSAGGVGAQPPDVSFMRSPLFTAHAP